MSCETCNHYLPKRTSHPKMGKCQKESVGVFADDDCAGWEKHYKALEAENKLLKVFARKVIRVICWGMFEPKDGEIQNFAEKLGLIHPVIATEEDVWEESAFEVGDKIYKFTDILQGKEGGGKCVE